jgi:hypothetical protein
MRFFLVLEIKKIPGLCYVFGGLFRMFAARCDIQEADLVIVLAREQQ